MLNNQYTEDNLNDSPSTLFVTDSQGNILISNEFTALTVGMPLEELLKCNVQDLVTEGYYDRSITMEAIRKKERVCKTVTTNKGFSVLSTAIPILYKDGEVQLIVTTSNKLKKPESSELIPLKEEIQKLEEQHTEDEEATEIVAESLAMKQILKVCNQIASYNSKVLIYGESGTGKEVIARYLHRKSCRANEPFIAINCAAIPPSLFEYELFGQEQGDIGEFINEKQGMFEAANGGTLFLDEISEMPLDLQAKLLRAIETNEVRRIGGITHIPINCRIIAATNRDLWQLVRKGQFREDLYYRINVIPIHIPPLRNRKLDLVGLISSFVSEFNEKYNKKFTLNAEEFDHMLSLNWPGNARELKNYIERLVITDQLQMHRSKEEQVGDWFALDFFIKNNEMHFDSLKDFTAIVEGRFILQALSSSNGNATEAAGKLGIHRSVIYRKLKKMEEVISKA
ncbi:sigma 54-interacting transcriptional regulator [Bacillus sp. AGMB 02131]|uniref:Sigma 54-interacting transcriptional regulator n=2 Tax=Peribacillus faecalis TaxID=2772559 RepID=A0A927CYH5_9BACI|nr:sigma 54-interacting transcriptional regulator [Peribacillus faecalis]